MIPGVSLGTRCERNRILLTIGARKDSCRAIAGSGTRSSTSGEEGGKVAIAEEVIHQRGVKLPAILLGESDQEKGLETVHPILVVLGVDVPKGRLKKLILQSLDLEVVKHLSLLELTLRVGSAGYDHLGDELLSLLGRDGEESVVVHLIPVLDA